MGRKNLLSRSLLFILGLFIMSLGVAFSVKAKLGVSPISCIPYIYSLPFPLTMGTTTILLNALLIVLQMALLRKRYQLFQLVQFPVIFLFGFFIDFTNYLVSGLQITSYWQQMVVCLLSCVFLGFGVFLEVKANITFLPGEGLAMAISETFHIEFGKAKIGTDTALVAAGILSSVILFKNLVGIREGTVIAAFLVGYMMKLFNRNIRFIDLFFSENNEQLQTEEVIANEFDDQQ